MIRLSFNNAKLKSLQRRTGLVTACFDLPAGYTCPAASLCQAYANRETGKLIRGKTARFTCYAARSESYSPQARQLRWQNFDFIRHNTPADTANAIIAGLQYNGVRILRIHSSGDFYSRQYFETWVDIASRMPNISIFGYTKVLDYVMARKPSNFHLVYSYGSRHDTRYDSLPDDKRPAACFVWTKNYNPPHYCFQYDVICNNPGSDTEDYDYITAGKSFVIKEH